MSDLRTLQAYDARAGDYAALTATEAPDATLAAFIATLPPGARVLDLGCGPGGASRHMAVAGLVVEALDAAPAMVALAAATPGVSARQGDFSDLPDSPTYDGVWANFSLLHASRGEFTRLLTALRVAIRPGGCLHLGMKEGRGAHRDALGRFYTYYTEPELAGLLRKAGFVPGPFRHGRDKGLAGTIDSWMSVTAHA